VLIFALQRFISKGGDEKYKSLNMIDYPLVLDMESHFDKANAQDKA